MKTPLISAKSWLASLIVASIVVGACTPSTEPAPGDEGSTGDGSTSSSSQTGSDQNERQELPPIDLVMRPGPFQLSVDQLPPDITKDAAIEAYDAQGSLIGSSSFTEHNTALLRSLPPGPVEVIVVDGSESYRAGTIEIPGEDASADSSAGVEIGEGYQYIETRDGTTLSAFITLPGPAENGPYPTLVEYSGYSPSNPANQDDPYRLLVPTIGFALVQVNVRGTGCSGGSFDAFERIQSLDGYDAIETIAAQPWSGKVGMFGISYPGIMQLHVASTRPPSLAAIAPLSVTDRVESVLYPGGIYNDGFGETWTDQVGSRAAEGGQAWAAGRVTRGDTICEDNQRFRSHNPDLVERVQNSPFTDDLSAERSAETYADQINVPVFLAGAWQDEQTGGRFPALLDELDNAPVLRAYLYNGLHVDAVGGEVLVRLIEFYNLYVGDQSATVDPLTSTLIGFGLAALFGEGIPLSPSRYGGLSVEEAKAEFESEERIVVLFDQGAERPNLPVPSFEARFEQWPPAEVEPTDFFLAGSSDSPSLQPEPPTDSIEAGFRTQPEQGEQTTIGDLDSIWTSRPDWNWPAPEPGGAVVAATEPFADQRTLVGGVSADLWVSVADGDDADLEVTVSEVAPDGSETYVQSGWLRLSRRGLGEDATELRPAISGLESDVAPVVPGQPILARVEVLPFAHVFRAGSKLQITIDTPGASKPQWRFDVAPDPVDVTIHSSPEQPSKIVLPIVPGLEAPTERPPCGSLRGQPCRPG